MNSNAVLKTCTVLILAPLGRDAQYTHALLASTGIQAQVVNSVQSLANSITNDTGAILIPSESIARDDTSALIASLDKQPPWSDSPFIYLAPARLMSSTSKRMAVHNL